MGFTAVARTSDLAPGTLKSVNVNGKPLLLAHVGGKFYAMQQKCPHMGADLCSGKLDGTTIICPRHAAAFDVTSGAALSPAKVLFLKIKPKDAVTYPVKIENEQVFIDA